MPVVRNPQFYFREGFCWIDVNSTYLKSRLKGNGVFDVLSMSLFSMCHLDNSYFVALINSKLISLYVDNFINNTSHFQINDARQLPIIISNKRLSDEIHKIVQNAVAIQKESLSTASSKRETEERLSALQEQLDDMVSKLYGVESSY